MLLYQDGNVTLCFRYFDLLILAEQGLKILIGALVGEVGDEDLHHLVDKARALK